MSLQFSRNQAIAWHAVDPLAVDMAELHFNTATDMGAGAAGVLGVDPPELQAPTSIAGMLKILDGVTLEQSGGYFNYRGETVPY